MSGKELFEGMSYIDERFIEEADQATISDSKVSVWVKKLAPMAACLCLIAGLYILNPYWNPGATEGAVEETQIGDGKAENCPGEIAGSEHLAESLNPLIPAEGSVIGEVPSVVLHVEQMTEGGFIGTVAELVDTDIFEVGMELNVVLADGTIHEAVADSTSEYKSQETDYVGCFVTVQFLDYDEETGTVFVNLIQIGKDD